MVILTLYLVLFVTAFAQLPCEHILCNSNYDWPSGVCGTGSPTNETVYFLNPDFCPPGTYCEMNNNATCQESYPAETPQAYPGEACDGDYPCVDGVECVDGWCASLSLNATCSFLSDCGLGMTCSDGYCVALKLIGEACEYTSDCIQYASCETKRPSPDSGPGKCVGYLSLPVGAFVRSCAQIAPYTLGYNQLCESTLCNPSFIPEASGSGFCASAVSSPGATPFRCSAGQIFCYSTPDPISSFVNNLFCACSMDGFSYCPPFPGDVMYQRYLRQMKDFLNSAGLLTCNIANMNQGLWLMLENCNHTAKPSKELIYSYYLMTNYPQMVGAEDCVIEGLLPEFYYAERKDSWFSRLTRWWTA